MKRLKIGWRTRDPITNYRKRLLEFNIDEKIISEIEDKVKQQVEDATEISKASPIPDVKEIFTDVWADGGYKWHN
jgi:pyruvate dehydrogenase E1 component alpha subunit